jgi:GT2 family glycosyltransferase
MAPMSSLDDEALRRSDGVLRCIVVGIPARDERDHVGASVAAALAAVGSAGPSLDSVVVVACDSCGDGTPELLDRIRSAEPTLRVLRGHWESAGGTRRAAIAAGLREASALGHPADEIWIATTDADTVVPRDWLTRHLHHAALGADAVAGIVELLDDDDRTPQVAEAFEGIYSVGDGLTHTHVHGANLGVRASAYLAAGGFPEVAVSEDHDLWNALRRRAFQCVSPRDVRVATSARLRSRAPGGFADTLAGAFVDCHTIAHL